MAPFVIIFLCIVAIFFLTPYLFRKLAKEDKFFTFPESNAVKFVDSGDGHFFKTISAVPGCVIDKGKFRPRLSTDKDRTSFWASLGVVYYGFYPFKSIHKFDIEAVSENLQGTGPEDWLDRRIKKDQTALRRTFPRPYVFTEIELADRFVVNLKLVVKFEVDEPYIPVYVFKGDFFTQAGSILQGAVIDLLKGMTIDEFIKTDKGETSEMSKKMKALDGDLNKSLMEQIGIHIVGFSINDYVPPKEIAEAIRQQAVALEKGKAEVTRAQKALESGLIDADKEAKVKLIKAEAEAKAQDMLTEARANRIKATVTTLASSMGEPNVVAEAASNVLEMEAATSEGSKITTLFQRGSKRPNVAMPLKGEEK